MNEGTSFLRDEENIFMCIGICVSLAPMWERSEEIHKQDDFSNVKDVLK